MFWPQVLPDKENPGAAKPITQCGTATVIPRQGSVFPRIQGLESYKKWLKTFFYVKNSSEADKINLPGFVVGSPEEKKNWMFDQKETNAEINEIHAGILELKEEGMTDDDLLATFVYWQLCPLQRQVHKMCFYGGQFDSDRVSTVRLDQVEVRRRVKAIAKTSMPERWNWGMPAYSRKHRAPPRFARQSNEDGKSLDKRFAAPRRTIDHEDPDSNDHMPIPHAGPRRVESDSGEPAAEALDAGAAAAPVQEKHAVSKRAAEKDLPHNVKRKKTAARGPKPKPLIARAALMAMQSQTCIAFEIPAAPSSRAEATIPATGEAETAADPTSPAQDVGLSIDATVVCQTKTPAVGASATEAAPSSAVVETSTEPQASETPRQPAMGPQEPQGPQPTPTPPSSPSQPETDRVAAARAKKGKGPATPAGSAAPGSTGPQPSGRQQGVPLRTTSGHSWGSLGQFVMDWKSADLYEVTSGTLESARQSPLVGPPPAATPESVSARMYEARVALFETSRATELCMNKRTAAFKGLLAKYNKLAAAHKSLRADRESQTGDNAQVAELLKRVAEV
ncbi:chromosome alignment-maintaining phosphoprotein 1-like [Brachypodium distachyon]|uniref:chromosome alignment-maintaining phosphoprotein 1-like n=1 Tax=Brachypodium distachyon TaxID=15368 RepID=UPI000D0D9AF9|nr:chromosome alignment-maintaining phosphoprotein 1-like [Brachypodium distachyon]|eukprot:XP_024318499.1 chromosome alignment-maintaining phosphoprotein 1-like [Brachypodium distachyon]